MKLLKKFSGILIIISLLVSGISLYAADVKKTKKTILNGTISSIDSINNTIVITDKKGTNRDVKLTEKTTIKKDDEKCELDKCVNGDKVRVFGVKNEDGTVSATSVLCGVIKKKKEIK